MRTRHQLFVAISIVVVFAPGASAQEPDAMPPGWDRVGPPEAVALYAVELDSVTRYEGAASLRIRFLPVEPGQAGTVVSQSFLADDFRGRRVRLEGAVRTEHVTGGARLWMRIDGSAGGTPFDNMDDRWVTGTTDWQRHVLVLDVPQDATVIHIGAIVSGQGTVWLDGLGFGVTDPSVAVTGELRDPVPRPAPRPGLPQAPSCASCSAPSRPASAAPAQAHRPTPASALSPSCTR